jgi:hypothetical protein
MDTHLGNAFAYGFAVAEISECSAGKASQDSGLCFLVGQLGQPHIEVGRPKQCIQGFIVSDWILLRKRVAQAFPTPALRKGSEGRGTLCVADAGEIRSDGHPPATGAKARAGSTYFTRPLKGRSSTVGHTSASMGNLGTVPRLVPSQVGSLTYYPPRPDLLIGHF